MHEDMEDDDNDDNFIQCRHCRILVHQDNIEQHHQEACVLFWKHRVTVETKEGKHRESLLKAKLDDVRRKLRIPRDILMAKLETAARHRVTLTPARTPAKILKRDDPDEDPFSQQSDDMKQHYREQALTEKIEVRQQDAAGLGFEINNDKLERRMRLANGRNDTGILAAGMMEAIIVDVAESI